MTALEIRPQLTKGSVVIDTAAQRIGEVAQAAEAGTFYYYLRPVWGGLEWEAKGSSLVLAPDPMGILARLSTSRHYADSTITVLVLMAEATCTVKDLMQQANKLEAPKRKHRLRRACMAMSSHMDDLHSRRRAGYRPTDARQLAQRLRELRTHLPTEQQKRSLLLLGDPR
ncbi:hypothetical protein [Streptomyces sp. 3N207]|uniref:hypothetical protein n=1 Tax=Streptomyces sp. 3N207 TaxID=3457417 RepID=UPI003FD40634